MTLERHCASFTALEVRVCKLVFLLDVKFGTVQRTWLKLPVAFGFDVFIIQPNFVTECVALRLDVFIVGSLLKLLSVMEVLLANVHQIL